MNLLKIGNNIWINSNNVAKIEFFPSSGSPELTGDTDTYSPEYRALNESPEMPARIILHYVGGTSEEISGETASDLKRLLPV